MYVGECERISVRCAFALRQRKNRACHVAARNINRVAADHAVVDVCNAVEREDRERVDCFARVSVGGRSVVARPIIADACAAHVNRLVRVADGVEERIFTRQSFGRFFHAVEHQSVARSVNRNVFLVEGARADRELRAADFKLHVRD